MNDHTPKYVDEDRGDVNRSFGLVFGVVFLIIALYPILGNGEIRFWSLSISGIFLIVALSLPNVLAPAALLWMKFGAILHKLVSPFVLGLVFFLVVTPTGMLMRILGKDLLRLRIDPSAESYWIKREPPGPVADSLNNQF